MSKIELYYPETTATKKINNNNGKIYFDLSFNDDFTGDDTTKNFTNNFARNDGALQKSTAQSLYISSANKFPPLSDPNYLNNSATHYLVIYQTTKTKTNNDNVFDNYLAIPICNNYDGNWSEYARDFKNTQVKSIDKLIKNKTQTFIDLNSTMNELKGNDAGGNYTKYFATVNGIPRTPIYVIDKFIYVEAAIQTSLYEEVITKIPDSQIHKNDGTYSIASISADCGIRGKVKNPSPLFDIGKDLDFGKLIIYNISLTLAYLISLFVYYKLQFKYQNVATYSFIAILSIPIIIYFILKMGKLINLKNDDIKLLVLSMFYSFTIIVILVILTIVIPTFKTPGFSVNTIYNSFLSFFVQLYYNIKFFKFSTILKQIFGLAIFSVVIFGGYELTQIPIVSSFSQSIISYVKKTSGNIKNKYNRAKNAKYKIKMNE